MKFVINTTSHAIYVDGTLLIPGTNALSKFDEKKAASFISNGDVEIKEGSKISDADKKKVIDNANTSATIKAVKKAFPGLDTSSQEEKIGKFEKQIKDYSEGKI